MIKVYRRAAALGCVLLAATTWAQSPKSDNAPVLARALAYQYQFRSGQMQIVPEYVAMVELALKEAPNSDALWNAMGVAYLAQGARAMLPGGAPSEAMPAIQNGVAALERAVAINPNHAEALVTLGGMQAMMASFRGKPEDAAKGVAAMNRAVEVAPNSTRVRLQRAFSGLSLAPALRNHAAEAEDLEFLVKLAGGMRSGEYVRILRADLHFELGELELARRQYEMAAVSNTAASSVAVARLAAMNAGGVTGSEMKKLRQAAGSQCVMCHGP